MAFTEPEFKVATGFNNAASLALIDPQPASPGVIDPDIRVAGDATRYGNGARFTEWRFGFLTVSQYTTLLASLGVSRTTKSAQVTIRTVLQDDYATYANYNAVANNPEPDTGYQYYGGRYLNVIIAFTRLEAI
ncbi:MAG: hypothetical protein ACYTEQ_06475 [Planctomycetota bacterium]|jgi:hypothetical protein